MSVRERLDRFSAARRRAASPGFGLRRRGKEDGAREDASSRVSDACPFEGRPPLFWRVSHAAAAALLT